MKRVFLIVLDSVGIGELPDAHLYGDEGSHTLYAASKSQYFNMPIMNSLGLFHIDGVKDKFQELTEGKSFDGSVARLAESSVGKDTTVGHWEIAGIISEKPFPTYPNGFPEEIIKAFEARTGRRVICNLPYSGTDVIRDFGEEHMKTGALIVYTSADSVFQIAAHEDIIPIPQLYQYCEIARVMLSGEHGVGRVIARPFVGEYPDLVRTSNRHDYALKPSTTMLDQMKESGLDVLAIGKINDIYAGKGITESVRSRNNEDGIDKLIEHMSRDFNGLCFLNLVDFDMEYGHRNDVDGYAKALTYFDEQLPRILAGMQEEDILMVTADHGCDPSTASTDHSREYIPLVINGCRVKPNNNLGTRRTFADIAATVLDYFGVPQEVSGTSFLQDIIV